MTRAIIIDCRNKDSEECNSFLSSIFSRQRKNGPPKL